MIPRRKRVQRHHCSRRKSPGKHTGNVDTSKSTIPRNFTTCLAQSPIAGTDRTCRRGKAPDAIPSLFYSARGLTEYLAGNTRDISRGSARERDRGGEWRGQIIVRLLSASISHRARMCILPPPRRNIAGRLRDGAYRGDLIIMEIYACV